ncbi:hypothetical protein SKAU_G00182420 [Synaphobranchus kaupii]|uniref:Uncharacterized protein n=1 Tax=Synaphobranchus kaupii TaxID=118154 RepID=A0A9Q1IWE7_SYNKA|nr:hypothetical protein SKAU_G00182420 [Synaphobranchus kaupii]
MVLANNKMRLREVQTRVMQNHDISNNINTVSLAAIDRVQHRHQVIVKQLYTVPFDRVKEIRCRYVQPQSQLAHRLAEEEEEGGRRRRPENNSTGQDPLKGRLEQPTGSMGTSEPSGVSNNPTALERKPWSPELKTSHFLLSHMTGSWILLLHKLIGR